MAIKITGIGKDLHSLFDDAQLKNAEQSENERITSLEKERASLVQKIGVLDKERITHTNRIEAIDTELEKIKTEALANKKAHLEAEFVSIEERKKEISVELETMGSASET